MSRATRSSRPSRVPSPLPATSQELGALRHPTKSRLRAVSTYEVLPDVDVWANAYDLFRFSEQPGECGPEVRSLFACPLCYSLCLGWIGRLCGMESDGDHFLTYYLTKDDDAAAAVQRLAC